MVIKRLLLSWLLAGGMNAVWVITSLRFCFFWQLWIITGLVIAILRTQQDAACCHRCPAAFLAVTWASFFQLVARRPITASCGPTYIAGILVNRCFDVERYFTWIAIASHCSMPMYIAQQMIWSWHWISCTQRCPDVKFWACTWRLAMAATLILDTPATLCKTITVDMFRWLILVARSIQTHQMCWALFHTCVDAEICNLISVTHQNASTCRTAEATCVIWSWLAAAGFDTQWKSVSVRNNLLQHCRYIDMSWYAKLL